MDELFYGFEQGAAWFSESSGFLRITFRGIPGPEVESAKRVVRVAQVASRALKKYGGSVIKQTLRFCMDPVFVYVSFLARLGLWAGASRYSGFGSGVYMISRIL